MSATNSTQNYHLPLFIGTDVPSWLVDWNNAMSALDVAIANALTVAQQGEADVTALEGTVNTLRQTVEGISDIVTEHGTNIGTLETNVEGLTTLVTQLNNLVVQLQTQVADAVAKVGTRYNGNIGIGETTVTISAPELTATSLVDVYFKDEPLLVPTNVVTDVQNKLVRVSVAQRETTLAVSVVVRN